MANKKGNRYPPRTLNGIVCRLKKHLEEGACAFNPLDYNDHSRPQRPRNFLSAPRIATSGQAQYRKSAIHGLPATLRMLRVKSDKSDWFRSQFIVFTKPFKPGMTLDLVRGRDSWCWTKGARPLASSETQGLLAVTMRYFRAKVYFKSWRTPGNSRWLGRKIFFCPISDEV